MAVFNASSTVKLDIPKLKKLDSTARQALEKTGEALLGEVKNAQVMPFDTGNLQNENTFTDFSDSDKGIVRIISDTPYARRLYFHPEYNFQRTYNIDAGGKWLEPWLDGGNKQDYAAQTFAQFYRKLNDL